MWPLDGPPILDYGARLATDVRPSRPLGGAPSHFRGSFAARRRSGVKSIEPPITGRTAREIIRLLGCVEGSMTISLGTTKVVVRVGNSAQGKSMELFVTTPTRSWSWSTSSTGEPRI